MPLNDDGRTTPQFLPQVALDQTTGNLAAAWYDARNSINNDTVEVFASVSTDGGQTWKANKMLSAGASNLNTAGSRNNFGDYNTMAAYGGNFFPIWADNSRQINPAPPPNKGFFDMATVKVPFASFGPIPPPPSGTQAQSINPRLENGTEVVLLGDMMRRSQDARSFSGGLTLPPIQQPALVIPMLPTGRVAANAPPPLDVGQVDRLFSWTQDGFLGSFFSNSGQGFVEYGDNWRIN